MMIFFFFFQAEDGIRDLTVTGVQTCALPIFRIGTALQEPLDWRWLHRLARCKEDRELRPAGKSIETSNLELRISERPSVTRLEQILGLIFQMPEIGTVRKRRCVLRMGRHSDLLSTDRK